MTPFRRQLSGLYGEALKKRAEERAYETVEKVKEEAVVEPDGAVKWKKNGGYLMDDLCEQLEWAGFEFSPEATRLKRMKQIEEWMFDYRRNHKEPTAEEILEARAAFGKGTKVVDVISGDEITL